MTLSDITTRVRSEPGLRRREREFSTLVENAPDIRVRFDTDLRHSCCHATVARQLGVSARVFLGKTPLEADAPPAQAEFIAHSLRQVLETGAELEVEQRYPTRLRHTLAQILAQPHSSSDGVAPRWMSQTKPRLEENARRTSAHPPTADTFAAFFDTLEDLLFAPDETGPRELQMRAPRFTASRGQRA